MTHPADYRSGRGQLLRIQCSHHHIHQTYSTHPKTHLQRKSYSSSQQRRKSPPRGHPQRGQSEHLVTSTEGKGEGRTKGKLRLENKGAGGVRCSGDSGQNRETLVPEEEQSHGTAREGR